MIKIMGGEFRSRLLLAPEDDAGLHSPVRRRMGSLSRPYSSRVKESIFNLLRGWFEGTSVLDLFAGVGTMGLEAVSRGASRAVMVERNAAIHRLLQKNIDALGCGDRAIAVHADALGPLALARVTRPVDVVFVDPPYELMEDARTRESVLKQIARCRPLMGDAGFVVLRSPAAAGEPAKVSGGRGLVSGKDTASARNPDTSPVPPDTSLSPVTCHLTPSRPWSIPGFHGPEVHRYGSEMRVLLYSPAPFHDAGGLETPTVSPIAESRAIGDPSQPEGGSASHGG